MGFKSALAQLAVVAAIVGGAVAFMRFHVHSLPRAEYRHAQLLEDSKAGNGSRYRVVVRSADTGGESYTVEVLARGTAPGFLEGQAGSCPSHYHLQQSEEVVVQSGKLGYTRHNDANDAVVLGPGEMLTIPAGTAHSLFNADNATDCVYTITHRPAGRMAEQFWETLAGLGHDYGSSDRVHPLQMLVLYDAADTRLSDVAGLLHPLVKHVVVPVAKLLGFKARYPAYHSTAGAAAGAGGSAEQPASEADGSKQEL